MLENHGSRSSYVDSVDDDLIKLGSDGSEAQYSYSVSTLVARIRFCDISCKFRT